MTNHLRSRITYIVSVCLYLKILLLLFCSQLFDLLLSYGCCGKHFCA